MLVSAARKSNLESLARGRMRPVAARDGGSTAGFGSSVMLFQARNDILRRHLEIQQRRRALDLYGGLRETIDEQALVLILRKNDRIRVGANPGAHGSEGNMHTPFSGHPEGE